MCPSNLAMHHPAAELLKSYATEGCPVDAGRDWTRDEIAAAIEYGNHSMEDSAVKQFHDEAMDKQRRGLVDILNWDELHILDNNAFPSQLKVSPLSAAVHKSRGWRAILDLSWMLQWIGGEIPSVNANSKKLAPRGAIDQIGHALKRIIYAVATAPEGKKIYAAKWDVKDGFWQMVCQRGAEWNFCYILPRKEGESIKIVKPKSLQMGWIDSPPFFGVASETARDVGQAYAQAPLGSLPKHKFEHSKHVALLNDNTPTISWLTKMSSKKSNTAAALLRVLSMRLKMAKASPLVPMHIPGPQNAISDIPSRSFGRKAEWHCRTDVEFLTLFESKFILPKQNSWTIFHLPDDICTRTISILLQQGTDLAAWHQRSKPKTNIGRRGFPMQNLWEWTLSCRKTSNSTNNKSMPSQDLQDVSRPATMDMDARLALDRSIRLSQPLVRRFPWCAPTTP